MSEVVGKLWGFCNTLRHDGIGYGDYIEQLTYLLFLKIAQEKGVKLPQGCKWNDLKVKSGTELLDAYIEILRTLSKQKGMLGDIFAGSLSKFREPVNLKKLITLIDETQWSTIDVDIKAEAYEGLLQKYAEEEKGAGQYFTPREAIRCVIRCIKPDIRARSDFTVHDPAVGTAGFLIGAYEWMMRQTKEGASLSRDERERLQFKTFSGGEIVIDTRRLALMNLYLHEIEADIYYGDSLAEGPHTSKRYDIVMTNPPFGTKGAGQAPIRDDFTVKTVNKQLNFVQHVMTVLKPGGRAAIVLPDNVLFEHAGREVRKLVLSDCELHTILRLPNGTFTPYSPGVKANIIFFRKGAPTKEVWVYDNRTNVEKIAIRHPLTADYFRDFEACYHAKPRRENERFKRFAIEEIERQDYNLDIFWLKDESSEATNNLQDAEELVSETISKLETAVDAMSELAAKLGNHREQKITSERPYDLPTAWVWAPLGDISLVVGGGTPRRERPEYFGGNIPWATPTDLDSHRISVLNDTITHITELGLRKSSARMLPVRTVLFSSRASIGKVAVTGKPLATNQGFANFVPRRGIDSYYLAYCLKYFADEIRSLASGTTYLEVAKSELRKFEIPLPSSKEQKRIVARIHELFTYIDDAEQNFKAAREQMSQIKHAILAKAFHGVLVPQDPNDEPASVLLEEIRTQQEAAGKTAKTKTPLGLAKITAKV